MSSLFDENNEQERQEQKLYEFYQVFSAEVRKSLLHRNVTVINNVYDALYPKVKENLLSKNVPSGISIDSTADSIRNALIAKLVEENIDLEKFSESFRKSLLSRNNLSQSSIDLQDKVERIRKSLLSKNVTNENGGIDNIADSARNNLLSKNVDPLNFDNKIESNNEVYRNNNISKNVETSGDLEKDSEDFRKNNIHKNVSSETDLEKNSKDFRDNNVHKNLNKSGTEGASVIDDIANERRFDANVKNNVQRNDVNLDEYSEDFRNGNIHKNVPRQTDLEDSSEQYRKNNITHNKPSERELLNDSAVIRKDSLSNNVPSTSDLLTDSERARLDDLSKNVESKNDLLTDSEDIRKDDLSNNVPSTSDLLSDSQIIRKDDLSKNKPSKGDLLTDSNAYRKDDLSNNKPSTSDLLTDSEDIRKDDLSNNVPSTSDLLTDSEKIRLDDLSKNKPSKSDLLTDSEITRKDDLSNNAPSRGDLLTDSEDVRRDNVSHNVPVVTSLESLSEDPRVDLLSKNTPNPSDLLTSSQVPRDGLLSANVPSTSDLLTDSSSFREDLVSANVPNITNLLEDSQFTREDLLATNVPNASDLLQDSIPYYANNISANAPTTGDLLTDSEPYYDNNVSANVPNASDLLSDSSSYLQDNLSPNVPNSGDLLADSQPYLQNNIASNVSNSVNLLAESIPIRNDLVSKNIPSDSDLLSDSKQYRDDLLSKNPGDLGVVFEGLGTATYLGVSKVLTQGLIIRSILESKNKPNPIMDFDKVNLGLKDYNIKSNDFSITNREYSYIFANKLTDKVNEQGNPLPGYFNRNLNDEVASQMNKNFYVNSVGAKLQDKYAPVTPQGENFTNNVSLGGAYYRLYTDGPQGGVFDSNSNAGSVSYIQTFNGGKTTEAIRNYNLSRNLYNLFSIQAATSTSDYIQDINSNNDLGFQSLINKTIGAFHNASNSVGTQTRGSATPRGILNLNNFLYFKVSAERLLRPNEPTDPALKEQWIENPESLMAKTVAGNIFQDAEFASGARGVRHIMKVLRNNKDVDFSINYDPQNSKKYIIGKTQNETAFARQRFTIANPYSPGAAKNLILYFKNYSSGDVYYFPPYIDSFSDSHSADWNEINFLGRPEPIYTYNKSNRDGTISFFVLTDYTQEFVIGRNYKNDEMEEIKVKTGLNFTSSDRSQNNAREANYGARESTFQENEKRLNELNTQKNIAVNSQGIASAGAVALGGNAVVPESSNIDQQIKELQTQNNQIVSDQQNTNDDINRPTNYGNSSSKSNNIYNFMTSNPSGREPSGDINSTAEDTEKRLKEMIKGLMFQPAFFSGSKVDFVTKMEFLAKLTKPARAAEGSGFSFTRAPIAHIKLGDWWDHDIVVKSVSVDYADSPWTLDGGKVQPMWAKVTISFNFLGPYGGEGFPVLSTDNGGVYSTRTGGVLGTSLNTE